MSKFRNFLTWLTGRRNRPDSQRVVSSTRTPAGAATTTGVAPRSRARTWEEPWGSSPPARGDTDDWPVAAALIQPALTGEVRDHHCAAPPQAESYTNTASIRSDACSDDDYNRNNFSGSNDVGGSND